MGAAFFHHGSPPVAAGDVLSLTDPARILTALIGPPAAQGPCGWASRARSLDGSTAGSRTGLAAGVTAVPLAPSPPVWSFLKTGLCSPALWPLLTMKQ